MQCPDEQELLDLVEGRLTGAAADELERHLDECSSCGTLVADFAALAQEAVDPSRRPLRPGDVVGRYAILELLGTGGMGHVYVAHDPDLDRRVALKLVHDLGATPEQAREGQERLLREAQAMARLSHPNVVAIHDVGTLGDRVFLTMELVTGQTLAQWLAREARGPTEVLAAFVQAGRGLAAAHAAGVVHRDFKPANVLIGGDGRVRVTDFGLARTPHEPDELAVAPLASSPGSTPLERRITQTGAILGTPLYMAPEQHLGAPLDARSDQFAFCVALYEALYRQRPFGGVTSSELAFEVVAGRLRRPPASSRVPARLVRILAHGLRAAPGDRYPSMDALLDALVADPVRRRRRWLAAGVGVAVAAAAGVVLLAADRQPTCDGAGTFVAGAWGSPQRRAARSAFLASGHPQAGHLFDRVATQLDRRAKDLAATHTSTCRATRVTGEQSDEMLELRMACLDRNRQAMAATSELLARADRDLVARALAAVYQLPADEECDAARVRAGRVPAPADPALAARVTAIRADLSRSKALVDAGKYREGLDVARRGAAAAAETAYRPIAVDAMYRVGMAEMALHDAKAAEKALTDALFAATSAGMEKRAADAALALGYLTGIEMGREDEGNRWLRQALGFIERAGGGAKPDADAANLAGLLARKAGRYREALTQFERAAAGYREANGPDHPDVGTMLAFAGSMMTELGRFDEAEKAEEQALALTRAAYGADHPDLTMPLSYLGHLEMRRGQPKKALDFHMRALALEEAARGVDSFAVAALCLNVGGAHAAMGDMPEARRHFQRSLDVIEKSHGRNHPDALDALTNIATTRAIEGNLELAGRGFQEVLTLTESLLGLEDPQLLSVLTNLGQLRRMQGQQGEACTYYERALAIREKAPDENPRQLAAILTDLAATELEIGKTAAATSRLERALALSEKHPMPDADVAETRFALARALRASGRDGARARRLAGQARPAFVAAGNSERTGEIDAFLADRGRRASRARGRASAPR